VWVQGGRLSLQDCDITSNSGVGVGVEGAAVILERCNIHDCERHGVAVYGSLEGEPHTLKEHMCTSDVTLYWHLCINFAKSVTGSLAQ
jgi:hypothetical protein